MNNIYLCSDLHEKLRCDSPFQHDMALKRIQNYLVYYITYYKLIGAIIQEENHGNCIFRSCCFRAENGVLLRVESRFCSHFVTVCG